MNNYDYDTGWSALDKARSFNKTMLNAIIIIAISIVIISVSIGLSFALDCSMTFEYKSVLVGFVVLGAICLSSLQEARNRIDDLEDSLSACIGFNKKWHAYALEHGIDDDFIEYGEMMISELDEEPHAQGE